MTPITAVAVVAILAAGMPTVSNATGAAADTPTQCAGYTTRLTESNSREAGRLTRLEIRRGRTVVKSIIDWQTASVHCEDVTGDKTPELIVETYSGGAHCCATIIMFQLRPTLRQILNYAAGNSGGFTVQRDRAGRPAVVLSDDGLAYYGDLCFACSPSSLPLVACYRGPRFVDCTRQFPAVIQVAIDESTQILNDAVKETHSSRIEYMKGAALGVYASHLLAGKEAEGLAVVRRIADPDATRWLTGQRDGVLKWFRGRAGRLTP